MDFSFVDKKKSLDVSHCDYYCIDLFILPEKVKVETVLTLYGKIIA